MCKVIILLSCFLSLKASAQSDTLNYDKQLYKDLNSAGASLGQYHKSTMNAMYVQILGTLVATSSLLVDDDPNGSSMLVTGGIIITTVGTIMHYTAFKHLKKMSNKLQRIKPASQGIGVAFKL